MYIWFIFSLVEPAYIIYYAVTLVLDERKFDDLQILICIIGGVAFIFRIILLVMGLQTLKNFRKGLKTQVFDKKLRQEISERSPLNVDL